MQNEETSVAVLEAKMEFFGKEMTAVKEEVKGLRGDFSKYLDNEALKWQKWGEMHSAIVGAQNDIIRIEKESEERDARIEKEAKERDNRFVTRDAFDPVRAIVYGLVGLICTSVLGSILYLVLRYAPR